MFTHLHGKEKTQLNIFADKTYNNEFSIHILNELSSCSENVVILGYRCPPQLYKDKIVGDQSRISFRNCFSDPFYWFSESPEVANATREGLCKQLLSSVEKCVIFVDDLLLFGRAYKCIDNFGQWDGLVELLYDLSQNNYLFAFINPDLISDGNLRSIMHISQFYANINIDVNLHGAFRCHSILRKTSGKVISNKVTINLDGQGQMTSIQDENVLESKEVSNDVDPTSNLTFNLRLTEGEKQARANTALPYILNESSKLAFLDNSSVVMSSGGGEVIYMPDEADDFDDEDPDDDLDF